MRYRFENNAKTAFFLAILMIIPPRLSIADSDQSVRSAYTLCAMIDGTGLTSSECEVSGWNSTVTTSIDTSGSEAIGICQGVVQMLRNQDVRFDPGWTLSILSPFSDGRTLATCELPS